MATNYEIDYNDQRFQEVEADKKAALNEVDTTYGNMISQSDKYFQQQIDASKDWADKQSQLQQEQTDFAIQEIEQQKENTKKDYLKEQSGAYVDWQKQSNEYGTKAEEKASVGMTGTGYSESSQVSMYNTYQNRVATAREAYTRAVQNYDNAITEARLQNNSILAEIAYEALQTQLELSLQGFQYKNQLVLEQANKKLEVDQMYYGRYQDVLNQINSENVLAEQIRQYNESLAFQREQFEEQKRQFEARYGGSGSSGGGGTPQVESDSKKSGATKTGGSTKSAERALGYSKDDGKTSSTAKDQSKMAEAIKDGKTANAQKKARELATMQGQRSSKEAIANSVVAYTATGEMNPNEAAFVLNYFGYDPSKYLE